MVLPYSVTVSVRRIGPIVVVRLGGAPLLLEMATVPLNFSQSFRWLFLGVLFFPGFALPVRSDDETFIHQIMSLPLTETLRGVHNSCLLAERSL